MYTKNMLKFVVISTAMLVVASCAKPTTQSPYLDKQAVATETAVQKKIAKDRKLDLKKTPVTKSELARMTNRLKRHGIKVGKAGMQLCQNMGRDPQKCVYDFQIKNEENLNAYADGKSIFVTPVMMRFAIDDDTLGMVLSHEYAHNIMGHISNKKKNMTIGMLGGIALEVLASSQGYNTGGKLANMGASVGARAFSPDFESEADYVGMYVMALAGYDIAGASKLWREMTAADSKGAFMAGTHPANPQRYVMLEQTKMEIENKAKNRVILVPNLRPKS